MYREMKVYVCRRSNVGRTLLVRGWLLMAVEVRGSAFEKSGFENRSGRGREGRRRKLGELLGAVVAVNTRRFWTSRKKACPRNYTLFRPLHCRRGADAVERRLWLRCR